MSIEGLSDDKHNLNCSVVLPLSSPSMSPEREGERRGREREGERERGKEKEDMYMYMQIQYLPIALPNGVSGLVTAVTSLSS